MEAIESLTTRYERGQKVLNILFNIPCEQLRVIIKDITGERIPDNGYIFTESVVDKLTSNDVPYKITISYFDRIEITPLGISFQPEHGAGRSVIDFDKYFSLPADLTTSQ